MTGYRVLIKWSLCGGPCLEYHWWSCCWRVDIFYRVHWMWRCAVVLVRGWPKGVRKCRDISGKVRTSGNRFPILPVSLMGRAGRHSTLWMDSNTGCNLPLRISLERSNERSFKSHILSVPATGQKQPRQTPNSNRNDVPVSSGERSIRAKPKHRLLVPRGATFMRCYATQVWTSLLRTRIARPVMHN